MRFKVGTTVILAVARGTETIDMVYSAVTICHRGPYHEGQIIDMGRSMMVAPCGGDYIISFRHPARGPLLAVVHEWQLRDTPLQSNVPGHMVSRTLYERLRSI